MQYFAESLIITGSCHMYLNSLQLQL